MRSVIDGKLYDTEVAKEVHSWWNGIGRSQYEWRLKTLYRTAKGAWFIHHQGGALTDVAEAQGDGGVSAGQRIEPISKGQALEFLQENGAEAETIEKYFEVEEA